MLTIITVEHLGGWIGRDSLGKFTQHAKQFLPPGAEATPIHEQWEGLTIEGLATVMEVQGVQASSVAVQVPLFPEAIQINIAGPAGGAAAHRELLRVVLRSIKGRTMWR